MILSCPRTKGNARIVVVAGHGKCSIGCVVRQPRWAACAAALGSIRCAPPCHAAGACEAQDYEQGRGGGGGLDMRGRLEPSTVAGASPAHAGNTPPAMPPMLHCLCCVVWAASLPCNIRADLSLSQRDCGGLTFTDGHVAAIGKFQPARTYKKIGCETETVKCRCQMKEAKLGHMKDAF